jgi:probable rRNA maturation factor
MRSYERNTAIADFCYDLYRNDLPVMPARFYEQDTTSGLKNKRKLSAFLDSVIRRYRKKTVHATLAYIFCTDDFLHQMNQQFLDHDTLTDIITFDLSESPETLVGEIYISVERVRENAEAFNTTYQDELHRVLFHGALHLCGYKDKTAADQKIMREKENECLKNYSKLA